MNYPKDPIIVIGAGIVGASLSLYLRKAGKDVILIDSGLPGSGASFGNAGQISPDTCVPDFIPGILRQVPGWLMDPLGPLSVRPSYFPRAFPWLAQSAKSSKLAKVLQNSDALRSLHLHAFDCYRSLLQNKFGTLIKTNGQIYFWQEPPTDKSTSIRELIWKRVGAAVEPLPLEDLRRVVPSLTKNVNRAVLMSNNGNAINSYTLVQSIADEFVARGGVILPQSVMKLIAENSGFRVVTNVANHQAGRVAVCAGAYSQRLLAPLGYKLPLETERGYHVTIAKPNVEPPSVPVICMDRPAAATPVDSGVRCAGTIEFAGLEWPLNEDRARVLLKRVSSILPGLETDQYSMWMGHRPAFPDSLPVIERSLKYPGLFLGFGHGQAGMTGGPPTARALSELIADQEPFISLTPFSSSRF